MAKQAKKARAFTREELTTAAAYVAETASALGRAMAMEKSSDGESRKIESFPDISDRLDQALVNLLEDEVVPIDDLHYGSIDQSEVDREVVKKALIGLKLSDLKHIAASEGVKVTGNMEQLASSVARKYEWNKQEVAELILRHSGDAGVERGHVTRIFPLAPTVQVDEARDRLRNMSGRYIRTGVAKWFLFGEILESANNGVAVAGNYRTYQAAIDSEGNGVDLTALPQDHAVNLRLGENGVLEVRGSTATTARNAARAFSFVTGAALMKPSYAEGSEIQVSELVFSSVTDYILDIVINRLNVDDVLDINPRVARFDMKSQSGEESLDSSPLETRRSELRSVKFDGNYLLDSREAARFIAQEKKSLVQILFDVILHDGVSGENLIYPVRITADRDHVGVQTGLGVKHHERSRAVHEQVVESVLDATLDGVSSYANLEQLASEMADKTKLPD